MPGQKSQLLTREDTLLLIIDVQERLISHIYNHEKVVDNIVKLLRFARIINIPVLLTEQEKLGPTVAAVKAELPEVPPFTKLEFDALKNARFLERLNQLKQRSVVSDAISSRKPDDHGAALQRMGQSGAKISSTEMVIYELLEKAGTEEFRAILQLVK